MKNSKNFARFQAGLLLAKGTIISVAVVSIFINDNSSAQIIPDDTLGNQNSYVTNGVNIKEAEADLIEGGVQLGSSLFHSFTEFNVKKDQRVYFDNPTGIADIFSRVTGSNASHILGTLGVNGTANLYLLNPKGIIFGPNAQLDIQGSLFATTADRFKFSDGSEFSATNPQAPPLLTMSVSVGVQYGLQQPASIINQGNLVTGEDLTLNAGSLDLQGRLEAGDDILLNSQQGTIDINGEIISKTPNGIAGDITIQSVGDIRIFNNIEASSKSDIDNEKKEYNNIAINSTRGSVYLNGSQLNVNNSGSGFAGDIIINASDQISILNGSKISSQGYLGQIFIGDNANNKITPQRITIDNLSEINTNNSASTFAGNIRINASDQISILNGSKISSNGNFGYIDITTSNLYLTDGAQISSNLGIAGNKVGYISIKAEDSILLQGNSTLGDTATNQTGIFTEIQENGQSLGDGGKGNITLETGKLIINDGALLSADSYGNGDAGDIIVNAQQIDLKNRGRIISVVRENANGNSGNIQLKTRTLSMTDDARISVSNRGRGNAGNVIINASDSVLLERKSRISSSVRNTATGKGGNIEIKTYSLTANEGKIEAQSEGIGDGGNINITTLNLWLRRQSKISTTAGREGLGGNGGSITIDAKGGFIVAVPSEDSDIIANAFGGDGGKIRISANRTLGFESRGKLSPNELNAIITNGTSDISASSDYGDDGEVAIETLSIDPSQGLVELPTELVDPSRLIAQGCGSANSSVAQGESEFVITGRGGLPPSPDDTFKSGVSLPEWVVNDTKIISNNSENTTVKEMNLQQLSSNISTPLVEAVGMVRSVNGDIVLTTQPKVATPLQSGLSSKVCGLIQGNVRE